MHVSGWSVRAMGAGGGAARGFALTFRSSRAPSYWEPQFASRKRCCVAASASASRVWVCGRADIPVVQEAHGHRVFVVVDNVGLFAGSGFERGRLGAVGLRAL